jgi:hypothetical protein
VKVCINLILLFSLLLASDPVFGERQDFGEIQYSPINEASGIVGSYKNENVFWTHNDSGDQNRIYAFNNEGQHLGVYTLQNCSARDWEDIAIGPGPVESQTYLYVGDIGDNSSQYEIKNIFRFIEPNVESNQSPVNETLYNIDIIALQYPDGNRDAETLMLDPLTKDIIIVSKREEFIHIYNIPFPQNTTGTILFPDLIHTMDFYPDDSSDLTRIVAGDISRDGTEILIKSYAHIFHFPRYENQSIAQALTNTMTMVEYMMEPQGEAVGWHPDGVGYFTISEEASNIPCHLYFYPRIVGCMDQNADNYNPNALEDDGSCEIPGDINGDGQINVIDIVMAVDLILGNNYDVVGDINEDGQLNVLDIVMLVDWVLNGMPEADSDGDGVLDDDDSDPDNPYQCSDHDGDTCDDCSTGHFNPSDDGYDYDGDGQCDAGDCDDDNDGCQECWDYCP